jgi:hypothetical protein
MIKDKILERVGRTSFTSMLGSAPPSLCFSPEIYQITIHRQSRRLHYRLLPNHM